MAALQCLEGALQLVCGCPSPGFLLPAYQKARRCRDRVCAGRDNTDKHADAALWAVTLFPHSTMIVQFPRSVGARTVAE